VDKQKVIFKDLGLVEYKTAWDYQESLLQENVQVKSMLRNAALATTGSELRTPNSQLPTPNSELTTTNYLLFCEHPAVYTLGKSGKKEHVLMSDEELAENEIAFFNTNRGGDITFHGPQQIVGYPILDLEKFGTDIGKYLRNLEEVIILTVAGYGIKGERSSGETGVWIDTAVPGRERKICAIGVRCSRWITMHGFAINVNTDLGYFNNIVPCGIMNKQVTSIQKELGHEVSLEGVKQKLRDNFEKVFHSELLLQH
jgi:lipoyl(octanoyl) transferase